MLMICKVGCLTCRPDLMPSDSIRSSMPLADNNDDDDIMMLCYGDVLMTLFRRNYDAMPKYRSYVVMFTVVLES